MGGGEQQVAPLVIGDDSVSCCSSERVGWREAANARHKQGPAVSGAAKAN